MYITIEYDDACAPWLEAAVKNFPQFDRRALKSVGWMLSSKMKAGIRAGAPGGRKYTELSDVKKVKDSGRPVLKRRKSGNFLGRMAQAIGYEYRESNGSLHVGWLSRSAAKYGTILQGGERQEVTPKVRAFYAASGIILKKNSKTITLPPRPTIEPLRKQLTPEIGPYYAEKVGQYLDRQMKADGIKKKRYYKVYDGEGS